GEVRALGEKPVAGMDGVGAGDLGGADHGRDVQVAVGAPRRADAHVLVRELDVERVLVGLRVDGHRADAHLPARVDDAKRHFTAIRDQDLLEHSCAGATEEPAYRVLIANSRSPYCTGCPFST